MTTRGSKCGARLLHCAYGCFILFRTAKKKPIRVGKHKHTRTTSKIAKQLNMLTFPSSKKDTACFTTIETYVNNMIMDKRGVVHNFPPASITNIPNLIYRNELSEIVSNPKTKERYCVPLGFLSLNTSYL